MYTIQSITQSIAGLSPSEKQELFQLLSDHSELLDKILPGMPLIGHITGQQILNHPLADQYNVWSNAKT
jgi:hypothetical protein